MRYRRIEPRIVFCFKENNVLRFKRLSSPIIRGQRKIINKKTTLFR